VHLANTIQAHGHHDMTLVPDRAALASAIAARVTHGDVVITLGAGDITRTAPELVALLDAREVGG
jgi:UDP-N-acetylmuramate--alanine ligase